MRHKKIAPGKTTRGVLIKVFLTIKPYPMKRQSYDGQTRIAGYGAMVINTLVTNFKKTLGKPLKNFPARAPARPLPRHYFLLTPPFFPALACAASAAAFCSTANSCSGVIIVASFIGMSPIISGNI